MASRFYGAVGYGHSTETAPGVWEDVITERKLFGDVRKDTLQVRGGEKLNRDLTVQNSISVVADAYANENFHAIKYVVWSGTAWEVNEATIEAPRILLRLGGVYNGPRPEVTEVNSP